MLRSYSIGTIHVSPNLVLAPMSGVTNCAYRRLIKELNPNSIGLLVSEFISVEGLTRNSRRSVEMLKFHPSEYPFGIQIFGYDIERMQDAAKMVEDRGASLVDINCGCPAPKVVRRGGGCELMRQPDHLRQMLTAVRKAVQIPVTMKFRSGWDDGSRNAVQIAKIAEGEGINALTVHGRTRAQLYRGEADWSIVREVKESVKIPVCGSGDVVDYTSARQRLEEGQVDGLYIGRASLSNPLVFSEIASGSPIPISQERMIGVLNRYIELLLEDFSPHTCVGRVKQMASQMCRGTSWGKLLCRVQTLEEQQNLLAQIQNELNQSIETPLGEMLMETQGDQA